MKLFIDDERKTPSEFTHAASTVETAIQLIQRAIREQDPLELISFDYDAHSYLAWTFMPVAEWMAQADVWPAEIRVHSASPDRDKIEKFLTDNVPDTTILDLTYPWDLNRIFDKKNPYPAWVQPFIQETA